MIAPFATYTDSDGNFYMGAGPVVAQHGTTEEFWIGRGGKTVQLQGRDEFQSAAGIQASFEGWSGKNLRTASTVPGTLVPEGKLKPTGENAWEALGMANVTVSFDPGDGSGEMSDGVDVIAELAPGSATVAPYGTFSSTAAGDAYNSGTPWSVVMNYEGAATAFPQKKIVVLAPGTTVQEGSWSRTGWQSWESDDDATWTLVLDNSGTDELAVSGNVVASRPHDATRPYDPSGPGWVATTYGKTNHGAAEDVTTGTRSAGTFVNQDYELRADDGVVVTRAGLTEAGKLIVLPTATGDAYVTDGIGTVAERLGGSLSDPDGSYTATTYGKDTFNGGSAWTYTVATAPVGQPFRIEIGLQRAVPIDGYLYVQINRDAGTNEVLSVEQDPAFATSMPANTTTEFYWPIAKVTAGVVKQIQYGPIPWKP